MDSDKGLGGRLCRVTGVLGLVTTVVAGCSAPAVPGYQVQDVPEGFLFTANADHGTSVFPDRAILSRGAWLGDIETFEPQSDIVVTRYAGNVTLAESEGARDVQAGRYGNPSSIDYGPVTSVTIDGRAAFAWMETRYDENGAVRSLDYTAIIPYDTLTYAVEFNTSAVHRLHPDSLTRVVHSWGLGTTIVQWGAIRMAAAVLAILVVLLVVWIRW